VSAAEAFNQGSRIAAWALLGLVWSAWVWACYSGVKVGSINSNLDPPPLSAINPPHLRRGRRNLQPLDQQELATSMSQKSTGDTYTKLQWVGYGVGGAMLITSGIFFYYGYIRQADGRGRQRAETTSSCFPSFAPNSVGALAYLAF
jgi:hypothetical protein